MKQQLVSKPEHRLSFLSSTPAAKSASRTLASACPAQRPPLPTTVTGLASRLRSSLRRQEEGNSMVEFALVFPILMMIVMAIFTFGIAFNNYVELTDAVGIAGRQLAISSLQTLDPCSSAATTVYNAAPLLTRANLTFTFVINGSTYTGTSCSSSSYTTGAAGNLQSGNDASITVTYPCNLTIWGRNYAPSCTLQASTTEKVQ